MACMCFQNAMHNILQSPDFQVIEEIVGGRTMRYVSVARTSWSSLTGLAVEALVPRTGWGTVCVGV